MEHDEVDSWGRVACLCACTFAAIGIFFGLGRWLHLRSSSVLLLSTWALGSLFMCRYNPDARRKNIVVLSLSLLVIFCIYSITSNVIHQFDSVM
jgi:hypothetical protein